MAKPKRIYLAGPEVFFPAEEHQAIVAEKKRLLREVGFEGTDPGTVFEVGYMIGQGKPAFGFTLDSQRYRDRAGATDLDELGHTIEDFQMSDNLMIEGGIRESGGQLFVYIGVRPHVVLQHQMHWGRTPRS